MHCLRQIRKLQHSKMYFITIKHTSSHCSLLKINRGNNAKEQNIFKKTESQILSNYNGHEVALNKCVLFLHFFIVYQQIIDMCRFTLGAKTTAKPSLYKTQSPLLL
jgi:hypothetical protein